MIFFFLAKDRETGIIIEDSFMAARTEMVEGLDGEWRHDDPFMSKEERKRKTEERVRRLCESFELNLIDYDGPFSEFLWRWGLRKPKWAGQRPPNIPQDEWVKRLKSIDELSAYKAGMEAARRKRRKK